MFEQEGIKFNFRVVFLIYDEKQTKVLVHHKKGHNFWILPGGRVEINESAGNAAKRELFEELGIKENAKLIKIIESFFKVYNKKYHEISFYYKIKINPKIYNLDYEKEFCGLEGENFLFKWMDIADAEKYNLKPEFIKEMLKDKNNRLEHMVLDEKRNIY